MDINIENNIENRASSLILPQSEMNIFLEKSI